MFRFYHFLDFRKVIRLSKSMIELLYADKCQHNILRLSSLWLWPVMATTTTTTLKAASLTTATPTVCSWAIFRHRAKLLRHFCFANSDTYKLFDSSKFALFPGANESISCSIRFSPCCTAYAMHIVLTI